jgi:hypothetical protein
MSRAFAQPSYLPGPSASPVLVIGDTPGAISRGRRTVESSDFRSTTALNFEEAAETLGRSASLSAIWLEFDEAPTPAGSRLLQRVGTDAALLSAGVVVSTRLEHLDEVMLWLGDRRAELLVDAEDMERLGALVMAATSLGGGGAREGANEANSARLRQLSEEVSRIASALARLSSVSTQPPLSPATMAPPRDDVPSVSAEALRSIIRARRQRANFLPPDLFADPAWDMLLDLLQAEIVQHRVPVSSLCIAAAVPATTALRWIKAMTDRGLLVRRDDPHDGRRVFIEMAPTTSVSLRHYFKDVGMAVV